MQNRPILEKADIESFRSPSAYIEWFEHLLKAIHEDKSLKEPARKHAGIFKQFYEELFPLYSLLRVKNRDWAASEFRNVLGNQNYDVEIRGNPLEYLEIVSTDFDDGELFRGKVLSAKGSVDAIATIMRDKRGRPIGFVNEGDFRLHENVISEVLVLAQSRLQAKCAKSYPPNTALIVNVDDYKANPSETDWHQFSTMIERTRPQWRPVFTKVFLVGPRGETCIEAA